MAETIGFEKIEEIMNDYFPVVNYVEWNGTEIEVHSHIPYVLAREIVRKVADACFNDDGEYAPEVMGLAFRICVVESYTNIAMKEDPEWQNRLMYGTNLWDVVTAAISDDQLGMMEQSINRRIKARLDTNRAEFEHGVNEVINGMQQLSEQFNSMMAGVEPDDLKRMIQAIGENGIDEGKIVQAVVAEQNKARDNVVVFPAAEVTADGE